MLSAAGILDVKPMDSTVSYLGDQATAVGDNSNRRRTDFPCRSIYLPVIRNDLPELFGVFDFADPHATTGLRSQTMVATQGLFMLNDVSVMDAAEATARRLLAMESTSGPEAEARLDQLFGLVLTACPTDDDRLELLAFVADTQKRFEEDSDTNAEVRAWAMVCQALYASSRFLVLE
jgi:Protein of unknown function (DUF1553)